MNKMQFYRCLPSWKQFEFKPVFIQVCNYWELTWGVWIISSHREEK